MVLENKQLRKAVIPAAGLGKRMFPVIGNKSKELSPLPSRDGPRPIFYFILKEAIDAGITEIIIVINDKKQDIKDYVTSLKDSLLEDIKITYVNQQEQLGLGHAILQAEHAVAGEDFLVMLPDDVYIGGSPTKQLLKTYKTLPDNISVVMVMEGVDDPSRYGIVGVGEEFKTNIWEIETIVEKPLPADAPSSFAWVGRAIYSSKIFKYIKKAKRGAKNEIQITDPTRDMILSEKGLVGFGCLYAWIKRVDCGVPIRYYTSCMKLVGG
ncbi:MAG: sugar phosphate nucleotidyltransferase [Candidatus Heimdallarchaeota archaeon]